MEKNYVLPKKFLSPMIIIGLLFLVIPNVNIFDLLPDFIGWLLIYSALFEIADLDGRIEYARKFILYMTLLQAAKLALSFYALSFNSSDILTAVSIFGVIEAVFLFVIINNFFEGFGYLITRSGSEIGMEQVSGIKFIAVFFAIVKIAFNILPELTAIIEVQLESDFSTMSNFLLQILDSKNLIIVLCVVVSLITGIYWYVKTVGFYNKIKKDELFISCISQRYKSEITSDSDYLGKKYLAPAFSLMAGGAAFYFTVQIDGKMIMPEFVGSIMLLGALFSIKGYCKNKNTEFEGGKKAMVFAAVAAIFQIFVYFYRRTLNFEKYTHMEENDKIFLAVTAIVSAALLAAAWLFALKLVKNIALEFNKSKLTGEKISESRYKIMLSVSLSAMAAFIVLHNASLGYPPLRYYLGGIEVAALVIWIVVQTITLLKAINIKEKE